MSFLVGVDTGGTFTDFVLFDLVTQDLVVYKYPSTPNDPSSALFTGLKKLLDDEGVGGDEVASVQLALPWPLFNKNAGNIDAAQADYSRALQDVERQKLVLRIQLNEVFRQYLQARNEIERYQEELLSTAAENMSLTEKGYNRLNKFNILRLLTARSSYYDANLQYVQSLINLRRADVLIDGLLITGALDAPSDFSVNSGLRSQAFGQK